MSPARDLRKAPQPRRKAAVQLPVETTRDHRLLLALSQVAQSIQRAASPEEIYRLVGDEMERLGYHASVFTLTEDRAHLRITYLPLPKPVVRAAEKLTGLSLKTYQYPLTEGGFYTRLLASPATVFVEAVPGAAPVTVAESLPESLRPLAGKMAALFGIRHTLHSSLFVNGEPFGILSVSGADLVEADVPAIATFSGQVSTSLDNLRLYGETRAWGIEMLQRVAEQTAQIVFQANLVASASDAIIGTDMQYNILSWNPAAETQYGWKAAEVIGRPMRDFIQNGFIATTREAMIQEVTEKGVWKGEVTQNRRDGSRFPALSTVSLIKDQAGKFTGFVAVNRDITGRKQAEDAKHRAEIRYRSLFEQTHDAIFILDLEGRHLDANPRAAKLLGYTHEEILKLSVADTSAQLQDSQQVMKRLLVGETIPLYERIFRKKNGDLVPAEINVELIRGAGGQPLHIQSVVRDITERKRAEEALRRSQQETIHANRLLLALSQAAQDVQRIRTPDEVYQVIQNHVTKLDFFATGLKIAEDGKSLAIEYQNFRPGLVRKAEKMIGLSLRDFRFHPQAGGIFQRILTSGETIFLADTTQAVSEALPKKFHALAEPLVNLFKFGHSIFAPLKVGDETVGILAFTGPDLSEADTPAVTAFANQAAIAMQNARLYEQAQQEIAERKQAEDETRKRNEDLALLNAINAAANRGESLAAIIELISEQTKVLFNSQGAALHLVNADRTYLVMQNMDLLTGILAPIEKLLGITIPAIQHDLQKAHPFRQALKSKKAQLLTTPQQVQEFFAGFIEAVPLNAKTRARIQKLVPAMVNLLGLRSQMIVPLVSGADRIGTLNVGSREQFTEEDLRRLEFIAGQLTAAIQRKQSEESIRLAEAKYRNIFENAMEAITQTTPDGRYITANPATARILGYESPDELINRTTDLDCQFYVQPDRRDEFKNRIEKYGNISGFESEVYRKDGSTIWISETSRAIRNEAGVLLYYEGTAADITERKRAQEALRVNEERYRDLVENSQDLICTHDLQGRILSANLAASKSLGYPLGEIAGRNIRDLLAPGREEAFAAYLQEIKEKGAASGLLQVLTSSGEKRIWEFNNNLRTEGVAEPVVRGMARDVTERFKAEKALHRSEERYRIVADFAYDWEMWMLPDGSLAYNSPSCERITGYPAQAFTENPGLLLKIIHPEDQARYTDHLKKVIVHPAHQSLDYRIIHRDGHVIWISHTCSAVSDADGRPFGRRMSNRDITDRKQAQEKLAASEAELRALFASMQDVVLVIDLDGVYRKIAQTNPSLLYKPPEELLGMSLQDVFPPEQAESFLGVVRKVLKTRQTAQIEYELTVGDRLLWFSAFVTPMTEDKTVWVARDITESKRAEKKIELQIKRLGALRSIDASIAGSFDIRVTLDVFLQHVVSQLGVDAAAILLLNPGTQTLTYAAGRGFRGSGIAQMRLRLGEDYAGTVALERRLVSIPDLSAAEHSFSKASLTAGEGFVSFYGVPLIAKGQVKGVLELFHRSRLKPDPDWLGFLETLAGQAAIAIDSAQSFDSLQSANMNLSVAYDATIEGWSKALDLRDKETEGHTQRVTELTLQLAGLMGISEEEQIHLRRGTLLHDIGKMGVPDSILNKPGPLTDEEWVIMRQHPVFAYEMLSPITYLRPALDIPYCHHEKWDGTGYPREMKGERIPLAARIFAMVDVWDALLSDRPYRKAWPREKVIEHIKAGAGTHFDPKVVEVFLRLVSPSP